MKTSDEQLQYINRLSKIKKFDYKENEHHKGSIDLLLCEYLRRTTLWAEKLNYDKKYWSVWPFFDVFSPSSFNWTNEDLVLKNILAENNIIEPFGVHGIKSLIYFLKWKIKDGETEFQNLNLPPIYYPFLLFLERGGGGLQINQGRLIETGYLGINRRIKWNKFHQKSPFTNLREEELDYADAYYQKYGSINDILKENWEWLF